MMGCCCVESSLRWRQSCNIDVYCGVMVVMSATVTCEIPDLCADEALLCRILIVAPQSLISV